MQSMMVKVESFHLDPPLIIICETEFIKDVARLALSFRVKDRIHPFWISCSSKVCQWGVGRNGGHFNVTPRWWHRSETLSLCHS